MKEPKGFVITRQMYKKIFNDLTDKDLGILLTEICECVFDHKHIRIDGLPEDHRLNADYLQEYFKEITKQIKVEYNER